MSGQFSAETADHIAVIGFACRVPGASDAREFWRNLCAGVDSITTFTDEELAAVGVDEATRKDPRYVPRRGALKEIDLFDAAFFSYSPMEAAVTDPQHRAFMETAWEAVEHAGYAAEYYPGAIGVYGGAGLSTYLMHNLSSHPALLRSVMPQQLLYNNEKDFLATRVAFKLNLRGPCISVQTACSTSLVAVHMACQGLLTGDCDMALAGGVTINVPNNRTGYLYQEGGITARDGFCRPFDAKASGTVPGHGAGIVVLKRLEDALKDGDTVYAVIRGSAVNNDGYAKLGYAAPSVRGQKAVISAAHDMAAIDPDTVTYVETHGTGTELGDPIEVMALTEAFRRGTSRTGFCALGSVKSNIGHLDTAAGVIGLIKTVLALHHRQIPPSLHFTEPNPNIPFDGSPFYVNTELREWPSQETPRRAGVSSFGIGGTNAHVVLEEARAVTPSSSTEGLQALLLSARTASALGRLTARLAGFLQENPGVSFADAAYTLQVGRISFPHRRAVICASREEAVASLTSLSPAAVHTTEVKGRPSAVFMFPGQAMQYPGMARALYDTEPRFRREVDRCAELLRPHLGLDLRQVLFPAPGGEEAAAAQMLEQTRLSQPALFVVEYALAQLWMAEGVKPSAMIGHSIGEYVAACLAGVFSLEDALALVAVRGRLMQSLPRGAMLAVMLPEQEVVPLLGADLSLSVVNSASNCVVGGPVEAIATLEARLAESGVQCRRLRTSHAFHSTMVEPILEVFASEVQRITRKAPAIPYVSNVTGKWITPEEATSPDYWASHLRGTVQFAAGIGTLLTEQHLVLLEVGPRRSLTTFVKQHPDFRETHATLLTLPGADEEGTGITAWLGALGRAWAHGLAVDWAARQAGQDRRRIAMPTYPFERKRYWIEARSHQQAEREEKLEADLGTTVGPEVEEEVAVKRAYTPPASETERIMQEVWQELLGVSGIGIDENFFDLGGDSLIGVTLVSRLFERFRLQRLFMRRMFQMPTIRNMAAVVDWHLTVEREAAQTGADPYATFK